MSQKWKPVLSLWMLLFVAPSAEAFLFGFAATHRYAPMDCGGFICQNGALILDAGLSGPLGPYLRFQSMAPYLPTLLPAGQPNQGSDEPYVTSPAFDSLRLVYHSGSNVPDYFQTDNGLQLYLQPDPLDTTRYIFTMGNTSYTVLRPDSGTGNWDLHMRDPGASFKEYFQYKKFSGLDDPTNGALVEIATDGNLIQVNYSAGMVTSLVDNFDNHEVFSYEAGPRLSSITTATGLVYSLKYAGTQLSEIDLGDTPTARFTPDVSGGWDLENAVTGEKTRFLTTGNRDIKEIVQSDGSTTKIAPVPYGIRITEPYGDIDELLFDPYGKPAKRTSSRGDYASFKYPLGQPFELTCQVSAVFSGSSLGDSTPPCSKPNGARGSTEASHKNGYDIYGQTPSVEVNGQVVSTQSSDPVFPWEVHSIVFPDKSTETFKYDSSTSAVVLINHDNQKYVENFGYDDDGKLIYDAVNGKPVWQASSPDGHKNYTVFTGLDGTTRNVTFNYSGTYSKGWVEAITSSTGEAMSCQAPSLLSTSGLSESCTISEPGQATVTRTRTINATSWTASESIGPASVSSLSVAAGQGTVEIIDTQGRNRVVQTQNTGPGDQTRTTTEKGSSQDTTVDTTVIHQPQ